MSTENNENLENQNPKTEESTPEITLEDALNQLAEQKALNQQYKNAITKSNSEAADWKRKFQAKQTAEEKEADAKREAEELQQQELSNLRKELTTMKAVARYRGMGMDEKMAAECAALEVENNNDGLMAKISALMTSREEAAAKKAQEDLLASRPDIKAGNGEDGEEAEDPFVKAFNNPDAY